MSKIEWGWMKFFFWFLVISLSVLTGLAIVSAEAQTVVPVGTGAAAIPSPNPPQVQPAPPATPGFAKEYLFLGVGHSPEAHVFAEVAYARKTSWLNGSFPVYQHWEVATFQSEKSFTSTYTFGLLFPFAARRLAGFDVVAGIVGKAGAASTPPVHVGYALGAEVLVKITRPSWKHLGIVVATDPTFSNLGGVSAKRIVGGASWSFGG